MHFIEKLKSDESGVAAIEYAVIGAVVLGALVAVVNAAGIADIFTSFQADLTSLSNEVK